ncbi:MAG: DUF4402 domain-containing protein [Desulfobacterales bacterium]|nr:DUF4402 domain-containing protein [Desulfobacterales bacterium]MCP4163106.1 DUF4402 domain-containing protein [Deltaproteobacteria bacterium]
MKKIILISTIITLLMSVNAFATDELFNSTIQIRQAITITEDRGIDFGIVDSTNAAQTVIVSPGDSGSAQFDIICDSLSISWGVAEASINMDDGVGNTILVDSFTGSGTAVGSQTDLQIGASAYIGINQPSGTYTGTATFFAIYN